MTTLLLQEASFRAVSPAALGGYVRSLNWVKQRPYRDVSDVYVGQGLPEIIVPRTQRIDDYAFVVGRLVQLFSKVAGTDPKIIYNELVNADRDVIRVRVAAADEGSLPVEQGVVLVSGARDMLLAAACSLDDRRPVYRVGSNQNAMDYIRRVRLGHTEQGSFAVTLLPPVVPPEVEPPGEWEDDGRIQDEPLERRMTDHFSNTLSATRSAAEQTAAGSADAFARALDSGTSANFCDAMVSLIGPFPELEVNVSWALTRPAAIRKNAFTFYQDDAPILRAASDSFRTRGPKHDVLLFGKVGQLTRDEGDEDGRIRLRASVDGRTQSVNAVLSRRDYEMAIVAHHGGVVLGLEGDLERVGQRWHLLNPRVVDIIPVDDPDDVSDLDAEAFR